MDKKIILFVGILILLIIGAKLYYNLLYFPIGEVLYPTIERLSDNVISDTDNISLLEGLLFMVVGMTAMGILCWLPYIVFCVVIIVISYIILWKKNEKRYDNNLLR